ncbi:MAG: hypothetical protein GFH27_549415n55 [Chloroflexi bacterium AL-W]|nr:hypothetical protein [Chloroflexi bacterium AL-N1]NOK71503.1 hypothetical protein [Chloroflexi bacterium AL-N10]NOK77284.1 hypothetical protein [Chloroflexi bacterium AL-N5]NOK86324.1 hypothetical protein [Chloroflexi bacterium AL-W]NOK93294.1 hypothetical protein [Chloroflexi bacterium AL-N15]
MMRWIQKTQTVILDERGSVLVDYVVMFAAMAWMVSIIMTVVTDRRFELGDTMGDTLEVLIDSFTDGQSGQANFGHAIYPYTAKERTSDIQFRGIEVRESSLTAPTDRHISIQTLFRSPINQTVMQPARDIQVHVDRQGRTHLQRSDQEFIAVYNPRNHRWYLVHPVTRAIMLTDLATLQRLGFLQSQHSLIGVTDATLGIPMTVPIGSSNLPADALALMSTTMALLAGHSMVRRRILQHPPRPPLPPFVPRMVDKAGSVLHIARAGIQTVWAMRPTRKDMEQLTYGALAAWARNNGWFLRPFMSEQFHQIDYQTGEAGWTTTGRFIGDVASVFQGGWQMSQGAASMDVLVLMGCLLAKLMIH